MIIWEGYTSDSFTIPWEEANDANVEATFAGTGDEMFAAMQGSGGTTYDMVSASSDLPQRLYDAGLLMEIDTSKLTNYPDLYEQFQRPPYITFDDKLYGVNFAWGPTIMLYNPDEVAEDSNLVERAAGRAVLRARSRPGTTRSRSPSTRCCSIRSLRIPSCSTTSNSPRSRTSWSASGHWSGSTGIWAERWPSSS